MYEAMEGVGFGRCFGAYVAGELCGFAFVMAGALPGYAAPHARVERIFVSDRVRAVGLGRKLMAAIEDSAKSEGCEDISYSAPAGSRLARLLFLQSGDYVNTNHIFCRSLA
jgi:GNAT superfamily N-acetyltransferase